MPIFGQPFPGGGFQIHDPGFSFPEAAPPPEIAPPPPAPAAGGEPVAVPLGPRFAAAAAGAVAPPAAGEPAAVPPPAGGSVVWISEAWLAPRPVAYGCPDFAGFYCPSRGAVPVPAYEELEDEAAAIETPVAAKIATVGGLGGLLVVGLAAAGAFGR